MGAGAEIFKKWRYKEMKVKEIIRQINDPKIYIEIIETKENANLGIYTKKRNIF